MAEQISFSNLGVEILKKTVFLSPLGGQEPYRNQFFLNKTTGELYLKSKLDRESVPFVDLVVKASDDCWSGRIEKLELKNNPFNVSDPSLLWVKVKVVDVNDNPPVFVRKWFTAGVTRDTDFAEPVIFFSVSTRVVLVNC